MVNRKSVTLSNGQNVTVVDVDVAGVYPVNSNTVITVTSFDDFLYAVTDCCGASATGSFDGVVCRGCYTEVDEMFGGTFSKEELMLVAS